MVSGGWQTDRSTAVAAVATRIFGVPIPPEQIIEESLIHSVSSFNNPTDADLRHALAQPLPDALDWSTFREHPLAAWMKRRIAWICRASGYDARSRAPFNLVLRSCRSAPGSTGSAVWSSCKPFSSSAARSAVLTVSLALRSSCTSLSRRVAQCTRPWKAMHNDSLRLKGSATLLVGASIPCYTHSPSVASADNTIICVPTMSAHRLSYHANHNRGATTWKKVCVPVMCWWATMCGVRIMWTHCRIAGSRSRSAATARSSKSTKTLE